MILESGSIPSREQKGAPQSYRKGQAFKGRGRWDTEVLKKKNGLFLARSLSFGGEKESVRWITSLVLTEKFQTDQVRLHS